MLGRSATAAAGLLLASSLAASLVASEGHAAERCPTPESRSAEALAAARACVIALERAVGPDAPELAPVFDRLGDWFAADADTASGALYFRRRALRLARTGTDPQPAEIGEAALDLARSWILSGRCTAQDPRVLPLLDQAIDAYRALPPASEARRRGLLAAAQARADLLDYAGAADLLAELEPRDATEWERLGDWRRRSGNIRGAAEAWRVGLHHADRESSQASRLEASLRRVYFQLGDVKALESLEELR